MLARLAAVIAFSNYKHCLMIVVGGGNITHKLFHIEEEKEISYGQ